MRNLNLCGLLVVVCVEGAAAVLVAAFANAWIAAAVACTLTLFVVAGSGLVAGRSKR